MTPYLKNALCCFILCVWPLYAFFSTDQMRDHNYFHSNGSLEEEVKSVWDTVDEHLPGMQQTVTNNHSSGSRRKRFLSYPRFVELMVTVDAKMVRHHGRNLEHYILTIMSVVSKMFFKTIFYFSRIFLPWFLDCCNGQILLRKQTGKKTHPFLVVDFDTFFFLFFFWWLMSMVMYWFIHKSSELTFELSCLMHLKQ